MASEPDEGDAGRFTCDLCGADLGERPWIVLNRWAIGTGQNKRFAEWNDGKGEGGWNPDENIVGGPLLCVEPCLMTWLQGQMIATDFACRKKDADA